MKLTMQFSLKLFAIERNVSNKTYVTSRKNVSNKNLRYFKEELMMATNLVQSCYAFEISR